MTEKELEKYSSAVTLSDMEMFIFPELILALALANMMSPILWEWKKDKWFNEIEKLKPYRRVLRVKQYIMQQYDFNLDLDTWGLTTKDAEIGRFKNFITEEALGRSNALFGYEGDKYYFDTNIRKHFGLDQYVDEIIPYWKTETIEAMGAFKYREGYQKGAGECVSFSVLYYAALFVVGRIPLSMMYMMATPLHSQNFVAIGEGILTNNRRIVTKNMWSNGTEISAKARRALENEKVTLVVSHEGYRHTLYEETTMTEETYTSFARQLENYLKAPISYDVFINFLRQYKRWQNLFYFTSTLDKKCKVPAELIYEYELNAKNVVSESVQDKFIQALYREDTLDADWDELIRGKRIDLTVLKNCLKKKGLEGLRESLEGLEVGESLVKEFNQFIGVKPRLPEGDKRYQVSKTINLEGIQTREELLEYMNIEKDTNDIIKLAFMAYRDLEKAPWEPFVKAALERNPVSIEGARGIDNHGVYAVLREYENKSIYSENRLAQPDEVWNYKRGDGIEKAICMWNILKSREPASSWHLYTEEEKVILTNGDITYLFYSQKLLRVDWK